MSNVDQEFDQAARRQKRRRRRRKAPVATVPIVSNEAAPPAPAKIEQPQFVKGVGQVYPDDDASPIAPSNPRSRVVMVTLRVRFLEILQWYATQNRITLEEAGSRVLQGALAAQKVGWRKSATGTHGGSVPRGEMGGVIGAPE